MTVDEQIRFIRDNVPKALEAAYANGKTNAESEIESLNDELEQALYGTDVDKTLDKNVEQTKSDFQAIKDKIVEHGVEVADGTKTAEYASKVDDVFDAGKKAEYDAFWDAFQFNKGNAHNYQYTFCNYCWNDDTFKPKYDIVLGVGYTGTNMFWGCEVTNIAEALEKQGVKLDTTLCGYWASMFQNTATKRIPELNCTHAADYNQTYGLFNTFINSKVETIDKMIVTESLKYIGTFNACADLKNIVFEGVIGQSINFQWSTLLSHDSIVSVITALSTTATGMTATFSKTAVNNAFETSEGAADGSTSTEWTTLIGTKTNWTISLV
jgi:hypothetical protein